MKLKFFMAFLFLSVTAYSCADRVGEEVNIATIDAETQEAIDTAEASNAEIYEGALLPVARGTNKRECDDILRMIRIRELANELQGNLLDKFGGFRYNPGTSSGECILNAGGIMVATPAFAVDGVVFCDLLQGIMEADDGRIFFGLVFSYSTRNGEDFCFITSIY